MLLDGVLCSQQTPCSLDPRRNLCNTFQYVQRVLAHMSAVATMSPDDRRPDFQRITSERKPTRAKRHTKIAKLSNSLIEPYVPF